MSCAIRMLSFTRPRISLACRLPSTDANKDLKDDINRYRELLRTARQTDDTVSAKLGTYQSSIAELTAGSR